MGAGANFTSEFLASKMLQAFNKRPNLVISCPCNYEARWQKTQIMISLSLK
jgi:hypothetical protein